MEMQVIKQFLKTLQQRPFLEIMTCIATMSTNLVVSSFMCDLFFPTKRSVVVGNVTVQQMQTSVLFSCHKHEPLVMVTGPLLSAG